jgi:glycosyltransferase involved in cell wall biosynthesis
MDDDFIYLHISSNTYSKNVNNIINTFNKLSQDIDNVKLIIKFNNSLYNFESIDTLKQKINNDKVIIILDKFSNEEMIQLYNTCNCYISPYIADDFNLPALEAQSFGKMVIHTNNGPTDEFILYPEMFGVPCIVNEDYTLTVRNIDIYDKMKKAYNNKNNKTLKNEYIIHTLNNYSWYSIVNKIINKYL